LRANKIGSAETNAIYAIANKPSRPEDASRIGRAARAASGRAIAAPPTSVMNSRRFTLPW